MQQNEKQAEPSMEDILASIRKIISEDSSGMKPSTAAVPSTQVSTPDGAPSQPTAPAPKPVQNGAAVMPKPVMSSRLSDVVRALAPSAVPVGTTPNPAATATAVVDDFDDLVEPVPAAAQTKLPAVEMPAAPAPRPSWDFVPQSARSQPSGLSAEPNPTAEPTLRAPGNLDSAALMPSDRSSTFSFGPEAAPLRARPSAASAVPLMAGLAAEKEPESRDLAARLPEPATPNLGAFVPGTSGPDSATIPRPLPLAIAADFRAADTAKPGVLPVVVKRPELVVSTTEVTSSGTTSANATPALAVETAAAAQSLDAAQTALGAFAASLIAPATIAAPSVVASANHRNSLDELILEMARPMVRDWLDANLPGMVERLLAEESKRRDN